MNVLTTKNQRDAQQFIQNHQEFNDPYFYFLRNYKNLSFFEHMHFHEAVCYILGIDKKKGNKALKQAFYSSFEQAINTEGCYEPEADYLFVRLFQDNNFLTSLIQLPLIQKKKLFELDISEDDVCSFWNFLQKKLSEKVLYKLIKELFISNEMMGQTYYSLVSLYLKYKYLLEEKFIPSKVTLNHLMIQWQSIIKKHYVEKITYFYSEADFIKERKMGHMRLQLPCNSLELYAWAVQLDNCLFSYSSLIPKRLIYGVFISNVLTYAVEIYQGHIIQMSGFQNQEIDLKDKRLIQDWLTFKE